MLTMVQKESGQSSSYSSMHLFCKFSNTLIGNNALP